MRRSHLAWMGIGALLIALSNQQEDRRALPVVPETGQPVAAEVTVANWSFIAQTCSRLWLLVPGHTSDHRVVLQSGPAVAPYGSIWREESLLADVIEVKVPQLPGFAGTVRFTWHDAVWSSGYDRAHLMLSFPPNHDPALLQAAGQREPRPSQRVDRFRLELWLPTDYRVDSSVPEPNGIFFHGGLENVTAYNVDEAVSDLSVSLVDTTRRRQRDWLLIVMSGVLSTGLSIIVSESIALSRLDSSTGAPTHVRRTWRLRYRQRV